jgi:hypothetical protein
VLSGLPLRRLSGVFIQSQKVDSPKFGALWRIGVVRLDIMNVRRSLWPGWGQVKRGMRSGKSQKHLTTRGRLA